MRILVGTLVLSLCFLFPQGSFSTEMSSVNYKIITEVVSVGGASSTSSNYQLTDTLGEVGASPTTSTSSNFNIDAGFWGTVGQNNTVSAVLSTNSINFGTLNVSAVANSSQTLTVSTNATTGYTTYVSQNQPLTSGGNTIPSIGGSSVVAGTAGSGIKTTGASGQMNAGATVLSTSLQSAAQNGAAISNDVTTIDYYAAISAGTLAGTYSQTVTYTTVVNF